MLDHFNVGHFRRHPSSPRSRADLRFSYLFVLLAPVGMRGALARLDDGVIEQRDPLNQPCGLIA